MNINVVVKGYKITRCIDKQSFRSLYEAKYLKEGKTVFMTVMGVRPGRDLSLLEKRAKMSQKLQHSSLVTALDYGTLPHDQFYYTHEPTPSYPIARVLEEINDPQEYIYRVIGFFIEALDILSYIHEARISHRNLSTAQIRITNDDKVLLEGFINAFPRLEQKNMAPVVEMPYMAPEQLLGMAADKKTDIYSMGTILYELVTGCLPYESNYAKIVDYRNGKTPSPSAIYDDMPPELESFIMKALSPRKTRYSYVQDWITDLEELYSMRSLRLKCKDFSSFLKRFFTIKK
jgi:eukaryotic-like serine/threonine-protein kinase